MPPDVYGMTDYHLPTNDVIFHCLFSAERNRDLLISLVSAVLAPPSPITSVTLLPTEQWGDGADEKLSRLDLLVGLEDGGRVDVEMQNAPREKLSRRALYYWARMYAERLRSGASYGELRRCVAVWLLGYRELPSERLHSIFRLKEIHDGLVFAEELELHTVELPKLRAYDPEAPDDRLEAWARLLGARSREELREVAMERDPEIQKAWEEIERLNQDPATRRLAYARETALGGYEIEQAAAHRRGEVEEAIQSVLDVLNARDVAVTDAQRARMSQCSDLHQLRTWRRRAATSESTDELFAE